MWQYEDEDRISGTTGHWHNYVINRDGTDANICLERTYQEGIAERMQQSGTFTYKVNFNMSSKNQIVNGTQKNTQTGRQRNIRRVEGNKSQFPGCRESCCRNSTDFKNI